MKLKNYYYYAVEILNLFILNSVQYLKGFLLYF